MNLQIPNRTVYKIIEKLEYISNHPGADETTVEYAESIVEYLKTNFKSKPNYVKNKSELSIHGARRA